MNRKPSDFLGLVLFLFAMGCGDSTGTPTLNGSPGCVKAYGTLGESEHTTNVFQTTDGFVAGGYRNGLGSFLLKTDTDFKQTWFKKWDDEFIFDMQALADGTFIAVGQKNDKPWIAAVDADGTQTWAHVLPLDSLSLGRANGVVLAQDGGIVVVGSKNAPETKAYTVAYVVKLNAQGELDETSKTWETFIDAESFTGEFDEAVAVVEAEKGGFVVVGSSGPLLDQDGWFVGFSETGAKQFQQTIANPNGNVKLNDLIAVSGGYVAVGTQEMPSKEPGTMNFDMLVVKIDDAGSKILAEEKFSSDKDCLDAGTGVANTSDGGYVVVGQHCNIPTGRFMKRAVNAAGDTTVWNRSVGSDQRYVVLDAVAALDTGGFLLAGGVTESDDPLGKGDVAFVALDAEGQCL